MASKIQEGDKAFAEGQKCLKTGVLKWNPDFLGAVSAFEKAALAYRTGKALDKAKEAFKLASDCSYKSHEIYHAAKLLEQASGVCKDLNAIEEASNLLEDASTYYQESGHADTAAQMLCKAAKLLDTTNPGQSALYYLTAADLQEGEDRGPDVAAALRNAVSMFSRARDIDSLYRVLIRLKQLEQTLKRPGKLLEIAAMEVLTLLHKDDSFGARDTYNAAFSIHGFEGSDQAPILEKIIDAYSEGDTEALKKCCGDAVFRTMDNEIAKLARDLAMGNKGPSIPPPRAAAIATSAPSKPAGAQTSVPPKPLKMTGKEVAGMRAELFGEPTSKKEKAATSKLPEVAKPPSQPPHNAAPVRPPSPHVSNEEEEEVKSKPVTGEDSSPPEAETPVEGGGTTEGEEKGEDGENEFGGLLT